MPATKPTTDADSSEMLERDPNMRDVAYDRLQKLWLDGTIQPQQWLSQRQVVEMIDAPLAPVRDALKRMEAEGLVILQPKRGIYTLGISPKQITEIYEFRMLLEVPAVGRVAERPDLITVGRMLSVSKALYASRLGDDADWAAELPRRIEADVEFHRYNIAQFNNSFITETFDRAISRQRLYRLTFPGANRRDGAALAEHIELIEPAPAG